MDLLPINLLRSKVFLQPFVAQVVEIKGDTIILIKLN